MRKVKKYLLVEVVNGVWKIRNKQPFDNAEDAWEWVDTRYQKDNDRLRFYLFPIVILVER